MTLGEKYRAAGSRPSGFDYMRLVLASCVIAVHGVALCYGNATGDWFWSLPVLHALSMAVLPLFFSLSGFLIAGSAERAKSLVGFLGNRAVRIYPALIVEVMLSALILGPIFTKVSLPAYFTDHEFLRYLVNVTGRISFSLPGVFSDNPVPDLVNRQLWTVPFELYCYLTISILIVVGLVRRPVMFISATIILQMLHLAYEYHSHGVSPKFVGHLEGAQLVFSFLSGIAVYLFQDRLPHTRVWMISTAVVSLLLFSVPLGDYAGVFTASYLTALLGTCNPRKLPVIKGADYSYGVYLYGWPVQQALVATGGWARHWYINVPISIILCGAFAALSWHSIEKPALKLKGPLRTCENWWLEMRQRWSWPKRSASAVGRLKIRDGGQ